MVMMNGEASEQGEAASPLRVLIVEDNTHFASTLRNNLEIEGFLVDIAATVALAQQQMLRCPARTS